MFMHAFTIRNNGITKSRNTKCGSVAGFSYTEILLGNDGNREAPKITLSVNLNQQASDCSPGQEVRIKEHLWQQLCLLAQFCRFIRGIGIILVSYKFIKFLLFNV